MKIDLNKYAINRSLVQGYYGKNKGGFADIAKIIAVYASATHCPSVVLAFYLAEDLGYTPELRTVIDRLIAFYGYTEISGQSKDSPYLFMSKD